MYFVDVRVLIILFILFSLESHGAFPNTKENSSTSWNELARSLGIKKSRLQKIRILLGSDQTSPSLKSKDWSIFRNKWIRFQNKSQTQWRQEDLIILTLVGMDDRLWNKIIENNTFSHLQIFLNRSASPTLRQACQSDGINPRVRYAACIAQYGLENTPAIVSDEVVDFYGGGSSAFSSLIADQAVVFEGYRKDTFHDLIQIHEGFHSAMRRLSTLNRMARLRKWASAPLAPNQDFDSLLNHHINRLELMAAPGLAELLIDTRFTSDHHGVIMATLHHGLFRGVTSGTIVHEHPEELFTDYPFHYIKIEQNWSEAQAEKYVKSLSHRHKDWLQSNSALLESLGYIEASLDNYR